MTVERSASSDEFGVAEPAHRGSWAVTAAESCRAPHYRYGAPRGHVSQGVLVFKIGTVTRGSYVFGGSARAWRHSGELCSQPHVQPGRRQDHARMEQSNTESVHRVSDELRYSTVSSGKSSGERQNRRNITRSSGKPRRSWADALRP